MIVEIEILGCDDSTRFDLKVDENGLEIIKELSQLSKRESTYTCMPVLEYELRF